MAQAIFQTDKRIRVGIWGLGRGSTFYRTCGLLNMDVVAGCDYNQHMRDRFAQENPGAFVTDDAAAFLAQDFDAVVLATFCPEHAGDAIACLRAGKHVLSEVTAFHTMAEGVALVEAVEQSGLIYNLAENYPFIAANMWLARRWKEGLFGELMYGEYEYVHECRSLCYTYIDGTPVIPGNQVHHWRSWLNAHYYNTHSLGPMMLISGTRPTRVVSLPGTQRLPGYLTVDAQSKGGIAPSLISMSNGAVVRNLMGATTNDSHIQRLWGTKGSAELVDGRLRLRLGGGGGSPKFEVVPRWDALGELAEATGHGGGDFWVLYYFARQILEGTPAPFDVYTAADCTIPGLLAYRSALENGRPFDVPDFRDPAQRDRFRDDHFAQPRYDTRRGLFSADADETITREFALTMRDLISGAMAYEAYRQWTLVQDDLAEPARKVGVIDALIAALPRLNEVQEAAHKIIAHAPESDGARVLGEMLALSGEEVTRQPGFREQLIRERDALAGAS
ncbi:MAG: Gfo/Idh/MocA family oxidoreductase [Armatimonadetes bacterium]|nr:Gfo/Idh/MocA family oxidoreductase [Armatimonadota bacterium]